MSNDTDFLARWSRRKHHAATDKIRQSKSESTPDDIVSGTPAALAQGENRLPFDPASLPTIESIGADSNIRAFLEAGVPGDLARAALRRVWSLDPAIRDFVGLSENSWDFNAPGAPTLVRLLTFVITGSQTAEAPRPTASRTRSRVGPPKAGSVMAPKASATGAVCSASAQRAIDSRSSA